MCIRDRFKPVYTFKIIELEGRINELHHSLRAKIMKQIQNAACDPVGGLNTIDYIDAMELIADKLKNLVKAGTYNFIYNVDILETDEDNHPVTPNKS